MTQGYCFLSVVPLRREPSHRSEMVSQLLRAETFDVVESQPEWSRVRCHHDGYEGWVDNKQYHILDGAKNKNSLGTLLTEDEAQVRGMRERIASPSEVARRFYLGAPYLWGGRSPAGIDCSGLVQVCFQACGIQLLRDASQQVTQGREVPGLVQVVPDDLCFFGSSPDHITHVAMVISDGSVIHSSGYVRIDPIDDKGIYNKDTHQYSHTLQCVRRIIEAPFNNNKPAQ
ncbi:MAG: C40 family peptidase [Bacteroidales bacterium]|nr:C40 family peptidase [Bacteroidales bacterium]